MSWETFYNGYAGSNSNCTISQDSSLEEFENRFDNLCILEEHAPSLYRSIGKYIIKKKLFPENYSYTNNKAFQFIMMHFIFFVAYYHRPYIRYIDEDAMIRLGDISRPPQERFEGITIFHQKMSRVFERRMIQSYLKLLFDLIDYRENKHSIFIHSYKSRPGNAWYFKKFLDTSDIKVTDCPKITPENIKEVTDVMIAREKAKNAFTLPRSLHVHKRERGIPLLY